jgi:exodeoxyribonuclease V
MSSVAIFKAFMADAEAWDMYITGPAGTGKTTECGDILKYCHEAGLEVIVCAYTHKACGILRSKLPPGTEVTTLHSYLKKRPTINVNASSKNHLTSSAQAGEPDKIKLIVIDEYSMIGEKDYLDLRALQDEDYDGNAEVKILWLGDPFQLPPVQDQQAVIPSGEYCLKLTVQRRRTEDNPLGAAIQQLISYIDNPKAQWSALPQSAQFVRGQDIAKAYAEDTEKDKVILCYTNKAVQANNIFAEGRAFPVHNDKLFCPSTQKYYTFLGNVGRNEIDLIDKPFGEPLMLGSKYKTLEYLVKMPDVEFAEFEDEDGNVVTLAYIFGHYDYKLMKDSYSDQAAKSNSAIEREFKGYKPAAWAKANDKHPLARARSKAWRDFLTFDECVHCIDFSHAMTVHKSQGSTFKHVYVDTQDLGQLVNQNPKMYLRLMYVALSRASGKVITN